MALTRHNVEATPDAKAEEAEAEQQMSQAAEQEAAQVAEKTETAEEAPPFEANAEQLAADQEADAKAEAAAKAALEGKAEQKASVPATTAQQTTAVSTKEPPKSKVLDELADDGFEGLSLGFGSFPIVKLENEGIFADTDDKEIGKWFTGQVMGTKAKYVFKNAGCEKKDEEAVYSYDGVNDSNTGEPLQEKFDTWTSEGWRIEKKDYLEVTVQLIDTDVNGDGRKGELVLASIPPTSRTRISGFFAQTAMKTRMKPNQYVTKFLVGDKVTKADNPFYPWHFEFVESLG